MPQRFFVASPLQPGQEITLPADLAHQIVRVLRLRPGEQITLLDGSGAAYPTTLLAVNGGAVRGLIDRQEPCTTEPQYAITIYAAPLKGDHFAYTLQKATELGAAAFVPILTERTVVEATGTAKLTRWRRIVREAAEQSGRGRLPTVAEPTPFATACAAASASGPAWIPWEEATGTGLAEAVCQYPDLQQQTALSLFIGPEGGLTTTEVAQATQHGIIPVTLGQRILRADTAAVVALTLVLNAVGDLARPAATR